MQSCTNQSWACTAEQACLGLTWQRRQTETENKQTKLSLIMVLKLGKRRRRERNGKYEMMRDKFWLSRCGNVHLFVLLLNLFKNCFLSFANLRLVHKLKRGKAVTSHHQIQFFSFSLCNWLTFTRVEEVGAETTKWTLSMLIKGTLKKKLNFKKECLMSFNFGKFSRSLNWIVMFSSMIDF